MDVFAYFDLNEYVRDFYEEKRKRHPGYSIRSFSGTLGYRNPSLVSDILKARRRVTADFVDRLARNFRLSPTETQYLHAVAEYRKAKGFHAKEKHLIRIRSLVSERKWRFCDPSQYELISNWHVFLVYNLLNLKQSSASRNSERYLLSRLRDRMTPEELRRALKTLVAVGLVRLEEGRYYPTHRNSVLVAGDQSIEQQAVMTHHISLMKAMLRIYPDTTANERDVRGTMMAIRSRDIPQLAAIVRKCHQSVMKLGVDEDGDEVVLVYTQVLPFTKPAPGGNS